LAPLFRGPPLYKTITLARFRELRKVPFSKERFTISVNGEIIEGRMDLAIIIGMQSGPDVEEPFKLFTILATSKSEAATPASIQHHRFETRQTKKRFVIWL